MRWSDRIAREIPKDKLLHFSAGVLIFVFSVLILEGVEPLVPVFIVAIGKEIYDFKTTNRFDVYDILATLLGSFTVYMVML